MTYAGRLACESCRAETFRYVPRFSEDGIYRCPVCTHRCAHLVGGLFPVAEGIVPDVDVALEMMRLQRVSH